jgi:hypothetical protein
MDFWNQRALPPASSNKKSCSLREQRPTGKAKFSDGISNHGAENAQGKLTSQSPDLPSSPPIPIQFEDGITAAGGGSEEDSEARLFQSKPSNSKKRLLPGMERDLTSLAGNVSNRECALIPDMKTELSTSSGTDKGDSGAELPTLPNLRKRQPAAHKKRKLITRDKCAMDGVVKRKQRTGIKMAKTPFSKPAPRKTPGARAAGGQKKQKPKQIPKMPYEFSGSVVYQSTPERIDQAQAPSAKGSREKSPAIQKTKPTKSAVIQAADVQPSVQAALAELERPARRASNRTSSIGPLPDDIFGYGDDSSPVQPPKDTAPWQPGQFEEGCGQLEEVDDAELMEFIDLLDKQNANRSVLLDGARYPRSELSVDDRSVAPTLLYENDDGDEESGGSSYSQAPLNDSQGFEASWVRRSPSQQLLRLEYDQNASELSLDARSTAATQKLESSDRGGIIGDKPEQDWIDMTQNTDSVSSEASEDPFVDDVMVLDRPENGLPACGSNQEVEEPINLSSKKQGELLKVANRRLDVPGPVVFPRGVKGLVSGVAPSHVPQQDQAIQHAGRHGRKMRRPTRAGGTGRQCSTLSIDAFGSPIWRGDEPDATLSLYMPHSNQGMMRREPAGNKLGGEHCGKSASKCSAPSWICEAIPSELGSSTQENMAHVVQPGRKASPVYHSYVSRKLISCVL